MDEKGLTRAEVEAGLLKYGRNVVGKKRHFKGLRIFLSQFKSPLILILILAAGVTYWFLSDVLDAAVILVAVVVNVVLGYFQEARAEKSLEALQSILTPKAEVFRDGKRVLIDVGEIVPGDTVFLSNEHRVAADGVILSEDGIFVDEALITGESMAVEKRDFNGEVNLEKLRNEWEGIAREQKMFMGTTIKVGVGKMLVIKTGKETAVGKVASSLSEVDEGQSPLQRQVASMSKQLTVVFVGVVILVLFLGLGRGRSLAEMLLAAVALAVAAVPEGLGVALTVILSVSMRRMAKKGVLVRRLAAAETLGSVDILCVDKTGTLTEGTMKVVGFEGDEKEVAVAAFWCNDLRDPLELAMREWAVGNIDKKIKESKEWVRVDSLPFDHKKKFIATLHKNGLIFVSGAPEVVLEKSKLSKAEKEKWKKKFSELAGEGHRLVGFASKSSSKGEVKLKEEKLKDLKWLGLVFYEDPVRVGVKEAVRQVRELGVSVKVITGDYKETAEAVMRQVGLDGTIESISGDELVVLSEDIKKEKIERASLFYRTTPEQKLLITEVLRANNHAIAMTGDGVNDAPALKEADIGLVVAQATEVAKETAEIVLLDNNFVGIAEAIKEGRMIFSVLRKVIVYLLADAFVGILMVSISIALGWPIPLLAAQILWINLITDGLPSLALTGDLSTELEISKKPRKVGEPIIDGLMWWLIGIVSVTAMVVAMVIFGYLVWELGVDLSEARTVVFMFLGIGSLLYIFCVRAMRRSIWQQKLFRNRYLLVSIGLGLVAMFGAVYLPGMQGLFDSRALSASSWWIVTVGVVGLIAVIELVKFIYLKLGGIRTEYRGDF